MASVTEQNLVQNLFLVEAMDYLVVEGFDIDIVPTPEIRLIYRYAVEFYLASGRTQGLNATALKTYLTGDTSTYFDLLADLEIPLEDPELPIADVVLKLRASWLRAQSHKFAMAFSEATSSSDPVSILGAIQTGAGTLLRLATAVESRRTAVDARSALAGSLEAYERDLAADSARHGIAFGLEQVDYHTNHIHPGELALVAAFAKVGKSQLLDIVAYREWLIGRIVALYTLENSVAMTLDHIACIATNVDAEAYQRRQCRPDEVDMVRDLVSRFQNSDIPLHILQPAKGERTVAAIMRRARILEVDSVIIDQISHVEHSGKKIRTNEQFAEVLHDLKIDCSGHDPLPVLAAYQINRDGKKAADKIGYHEMEQLADSSAAEREPDWVFSLYQSHDMVAANRALFQILASRRTSIKWWDISWQINLSFMQVHNEVQPFQV